jgi:MYXO-CTERM domain-containing protein
MFNSIRTLQAAALGVVAMGAVTLTSTDASACGGFFCNANQPVNQAAERIIFSDNPDDTVTAVVQILYQGPAEEFAWVLPVPTLPDDVEISSNAAFTQVQSVTNPSYRLNTRVEGECKEEEAARGVPNGNNGVAFGADGTNSSANNDAGVNVLARGNTGPYNWVVIEIEESTTDKVQVALDWLTTNGYDLTELGPDVIEPYLEEGMKLIAFKLNKTSDSGDIRPIRITYESDIPMIPIKLTAVAANDDMGVMTWVLGEHRAVPTNYKDLVLNEALINWFNAGPTYNNVVIAAANEAGGNGFVTEYAGSTDIFDQVVFSQGHADQWDQINNTDWTDRERELLDAVWSLAQSPDPNFFTSTAWDGMRDAVDLAFPDLDDATRQQIVDCGGCAFYEENVPADFDIQGYLTAVYDFVIEPMEATQELLDSRPYATRLYTTLSPEEMRTDPCFDFNPDLEDVSNVHVAERIIECHPGITQSQAPWRAELPSGVVVRGEAGGGWPFQVGDDGMPTNRTIGDAQTNGATKILEDNTDTIRQTLEEHNAGVRTPEEIADEYRARNGEAAGGACSTTHATPARTGGVVLLLLGLIFGLRRRR